MPLGRGVLLLKGEPTGLLAFDKPAGVLSHPNSRDDEDRALLTCTYDDEGQFYKWQDEAGRTRRLWLLNRLDSATSGVILLADSQELADLIREGFRRKFVHKVYQALVFGTPSVPSQVWRDRLAIEKKGGQVRTSSAGNIPSECAMKLVARRAGAQVVSLLRLEPRTGRSHQLRVQCAKRNLPIVGDATYGDFSANRLFAKTHGTKRLFLHSLETSFDYEFGGKVHRFAVKAPLPAEFTL
jgi:23S rRNA-/tRNA-specific pseudouridylate synthase